MAGDYDKKKGSVEGENTRLWREVKRGSYGDHGDAWVRIGAVWPKADRAELADQSGPKAVAERSALVNGGRDEQCALLITVLDCPPSSRRTVLSPLALALVFRTVASDGEAAAAIIGSRLCRVVVRGLLAVKVLSISSLAIDIRRGYQREAKDGDDTLIKG